MRLENVMPDYEVSCRALAPGQQRKDMPAQLPQLLLALPSLSDLSLTNVTVIGLLDLSQESGHNWSKLRYGTTSHSQQAAVPAQQCLSYDRHATYCPGCTP